eukprot:2373-Eustigmatos_ZCMA.PRE.1
MRLKVHTARISLSRKTGPGCHCCRLVGAAEGIHLRASATRIYISPLLHMLVLFYTCVGGWCLNGTLSPDC